LTQVSKLKVIQNSFEFFQSFEVKLALEQTSGITN